MNVFVLGTGRCGTKAFVHACEHIANYSCAHESRSGLLGRDRLDYPQNHIEADNRLSWLLGRLERKYGDEAFYVHLRRNETDTATSFARRYSYGIIRAYRGGGILMGLSEQTDPLAVSLDYCDTVNSNIDLFLKDKSRKMTISLEQVDRGFAEFWRRIGAQGDYDAALAEFSRRHNATSESGAGTQRQLLARVAGKLARLVVKLPGYIRNA